MTSKEIHKATAQELLGAVPADFTCPAGSKNFRGTIVEPHNGWEASSHYVTLVSFSENNPIHTSIFFTGFLDAKGNPGMYNGFPRYGAYGAQLSLQNIYFMKVLRKIDMTV